MTELPTDRPLTKTEIELAVAKALLRETRNFILPGSFLTPIQIGSYLGLRDAELHHFHQQNDHATFHQAANTFINRLISLGVLEVDWGQGSWGFCRLTEDGKKQLTNLASLESAFTLQFVEGLQDDELRRRCGQEVIRSGEPDTLIREACTVLENRLRGKTNAQAGTRRYDLPSIAFLQRPPRIKLSDDGQEQEAGGWLYKGVLGYFGNRVHHELVDFPAQRARQVVAFIDSLLSMLEEAAKQPQP